MIDGIRSKELGTVGVVGSVVDWGINWGDTVEVRMTRVAFDNMIALLRAVPETVKEHHSRVFTDVSGEMLLWP